MLNRSRLDSLVGLLDKAWPVLDGIPHGAAMDEIELL